jgi:hypothetical protein
MKWATYLDISRELSPRVVAHYCPRLSLSRTELVLVKAFTVSEKSCVSFVLGKDEITFWIRELNMTLGPWKGLVARA